MEIDNLEAMNERFYRKGFDTYLNETYAQQIQSGKPEFELEHTARIKDDDMHYKLHFKVDAEAGQVYLNNIDATLHKSADGTRPERTHSFPSDWLITAGEMHRLLKHGLLVSVNKNLINKKRRVL